MKNGNIVFSALLLFNTSISILFAQKSESIDLYKKGLIFYDSKEYNKAIVLLEQAIEKDNTNFIG